SDVRAIDASAEWRWQRVVLFQLVDDEVDVFGEISPIAPIEPHAEQMPPSASCHRGVCADMTGMNAHISITRPMRSEISVTNTRVTQSVREDDDRHGFVRFGRVNVHRHMALPLGVEPIAVVLHNAVWTGMRELCESGILQRAARNGRAGCCQYETGDRCGAVHIQDCGLIHRPTSGGTLAARVAARGAG